MAATTKNPSADETALLTVAAAWKLSTGQLVVASLVVLLAALLRIAAARGELWLDEVWSLRLVEEIVRWPSDVVFRLRHDNNHMLNSLVVYFIGPNAAAWQYRGPAVLAGVATVVLAGWAQRSLGSATALTAMILVGFSYLLVHYSSEARGYAYLMCCMLLVFGSLTKADQTGKLGWEVLASASCLLGMLAHPLFLNMWLSIQVWTWLPNGVRTDRTELRRLAVAAIFRTIVPGLFFGWLYWVNWSHMEIGGGDHQPYFQIVLQTLSLACGGPFVGPGVYVAAIVALVLTTLAWWHVARQSPRRAGFFATVILLAPTLLLLVASRGDIYPRYFLGSVLFMYLLWSEWLGSIVERFSGRRMWIASVLAIFIIANGIHIGQLIAHERGHYRDAIALMDQETTAGEVSVALDHPFRQGLMIEYYGRPSQDAKPLQIYLPDSGAEWLLIHDLSADFTSPEVLTLDGSVEYRLVKAYPFPGLSGWHLSVYRREM